ncbi:4Fe-4S ferredoxin (plasmid) [Pseudonocardia sp. EC080610-09]|uniref:4Fe-4S dicluster domain-containing protein n=1 Tax=unclassified Pseudonocardia TaxID=2619320 RepID=UPI0007065DD8|nr:MULTISPECIES: ferredoxin family protein [unclassified Pseudonocardia]ALL79434.1 4Fe-4S ferredoxin [Pseudonocardia sp. EC080610-09]ALL85613.1 4Fe-4S ferredoxin [Pseudonocardia sp. EC080619-01]
MIEIVDAARCITCDRCVEVCPTNVFDTGDDGVPVLARLHDCQTCYLCEAYCPADALYVSPVTHPCAPVPPDALASAGLLGGYRSALGWGAGRRLGARTAIGPPLPAATPPRRGEPGR